MSKKLKLLAVATLVAISSFSLVADSHANGRGWRGHGPGWNGNYYRGGGWNRGVGLGIAAGVLGGVAAGLAGGAYASGYPYYGVPPPLGYRYWQPQPSYYVPPYCLGYCGW